MFDEKELISQCLAGNRVAEKQLFDTYSSCFLGICMRYADSRAEAEDMLITGFTRIFKNLDSYDGSGSFFGWMKSVIIHNAVDWTRQRSDWEYIDDQPSSQRTFSTKMSHAFDCEEIVMAIRKLPIQYRDIFNLYVVEGFAHKEIAKMLGMNEHTVRVYYSKAKRRLQELLKDYRKDG